MALVLFALFFSIMFHKVSGYLDADVEFQFRNNGGLLNYKVFKAKILVKYSIIHDFLFSDDAALVSITIEEAHHLVHRFSPV